ncbi:elongin-A [Paramormyrops kingsleyae]|uniref:elongin-A n=1 Tax=Paramormyrops kingsleyae TaxID=1676925 RepID=UPI003B96F284
MAEDLLEVVEKLQSRLTENQEPRKLLKTLKRLEGLPMTIDILVETGVGKSVNSLRKHETVGPMAKTLVARWKMLVPQPVERPPAGKEARGHTRGGESGGRKRHREPSPEQPQYEDEHQDEEMLDHQQQEEEEEEEEGGSQYHTGSPSSPLHHQYSPQRVHRGHHSDGYESPHAEEEALTPPPRKEVRHSKQHKEPGRAQSSRGDRRPERRHQHGQKGGAEGKKRSAEGDRRPGATHKSSKHGVRDMKKEKRAASEAPSQDRRPSPEVPRGGDKEEAYEAPTMSFESFLTYDDPTPSKKKKKPSRPGHTAAPPAAHATPPKPSKTNGMSTKRPDPPAEPTPTPPTPERRRKVIDVVPALPEIPLPAIQPNYRPLPSIEVTPLSPQRRKVPVSCDEEDAGFTGRRLNTKMSVYSGAKTTFLPKMISLYEQCIRVLQNNIDSIDEVGGVPYEILEPVLERCTPEQLYRIEQCNQCFMEETDELWMRHCQRDFKHGSPQEYESWREMYLRLHDEREERLRMLTQNISSAHANRPKGRQVKMAFVNSVAKPPRDVRRRQEKFGTTSGGGASGSGNSAAVGMSAPAQMRTATLCSSQPGDSGGPAEISLPPPPRFSTGGHSSSGSAHSARDKPQVKKIAPMMAKTIKAFKNRFSRR